MVVLLQTLGVIVFLIEVDDVVPASKNSIHSAEPIAVLRSERIDLSLGLSNSISGSDRIS